MLLAPIIIMAHDYSHALSTINASWVYHVESVSKMVLVLSITFLQYMGLHLLNWFSLGDWKGIFITHLIFIIKLAVSTFPIVVIFFRSCVSEMVVPYYLIYYRYISGTLGPCFNYWCSVYWCSVYGICKWSDTLWPAGLTFRALSYNVAIRW